MGYRNTKTLTEKMHNTTQKLSILDQLMLLAIDDNKGTFVSDYSIFGYCLAGAALYDLTLKGKIVIENERVKVINREKVNDLALDKCLEMIDQSKKERKVKTWIDKLGQREKSLRKHSLNKLIGLNILEEKEDKILWIFSNNKYPTKNEIPENVIRKRLMDIIQEEQSPDNNDIMLISLVNACSLNKEVYGKKVAKEKKKEIKAIIKNYQFADETSTLIKEIHESIIAALTIIMIVPVIAAT
ncbi:hypothetical protein NH26_23865 [Flammeovirga pacifica]|uniref:GPP34 family phosphoprotein n=2 Tax=Flammeovirga pacifica TaxID=915059 RepID=A0A1S1YUA6_FLAPC|nr:hypothetical protein NH26_23865 [Flammeovirga pacifica]